MASIRFSMVGDSVNTFLYTQYQDQVRQLVEQIDQHDYELLSTRARSAIQRIEQDWPLNDLGHIGLDNGVWKRVLTQEWPLLHHGAGGLITSDEINVYPFPEPRDIGYWFLIVLAEFLGPCPSPAGNWSVLRDVLLVRGWNQHETETLFQGLPPYQLLKPDIVEKPPSPRTSASPYWFWLHAGQGKSGWLPIEEIHKFHNRLREMEDEIADFDLQELPEIDVENPIVIRDYKKYLHCGYRDTIAMLLAAKELNRGLFMSITL